MRPKNPQQNLQNKAEVLIALAVHESEDTKQPPSQQELADFFENSKRFSKKRQDEIFAYLDSNPQAYDRWIKQGKQATQSRHISLSSTMPYAIAVVILLLMVGVVLLRQGQEFRLDRAVDQAYQQVVSSDNSESFEHTMQSLTDSLKQPRQSLSFSQRGQPSQMSQTFMLGLQHHRAAIGQQKTGGDPLPHAQQKDYQLGRWYTVLWTISQQNTVMPTSFWKEQLNILNHLQIHYTGQTSNVSAPDDAKAVALQLERMHPLLQELAENSKITKPYKQLEQTLIALRYSLIPALKFD